MYLVAYDFDTIAAHYDRMNRLMTFGLDRCWRKRAVRGLNGSVLDVACGTGDMALLLAEQGATVTGVDLSSEMLALAKAKATRRMSCGAGFSPRIVLRQADAEHLPFGDATFDAVTCAFGVRNFVHLDQGLEEMLRVLKPGGRMVILEMATPDSAMLKPFYNLYTRRVIPLMGKLLAGNREAYTYLPQSIERFPKGALFVEKVQRSGCNAAERKLAFGVCRLYTVSKNKEAAVDGRPLCY